MWKNWNLFKRRTEDNSNVSVNPEVVTDGKENTSVISARDVGGNVGVYNNNYNQLEFGENDSSRNLSVNNCSFSQVNGYNNSGEGNSCVQASFEQESVRSLSGVRTSDDVHVNGQNGGFTPKRRMGPVSSLKRPASPFTQSDSSNLPRGASETGRNDGTNSSFSGVYGPLLSSPLVPKVRRALESSTGVRSPQATLLSRGNPIGRSSSLNYGSGNPVKSTAGKVPWVRLKRKESLTLTDLVNGSTPQSPNTVKLAVPESRHLPAAPNFKTTPLIVTTEHSRARVVDTQAVVSALREKRKRFGGGQREETFSEDSWINAAKRRRQDSSQSNASSVSIPSMPESLPDLMGTPGVSLLHIENLKDQRPSTVPAMDAFVSRHQREFGLGGDMLGQSPQLQVYNQVQHQEVPGGLNNQKSALRSIQSSLSSSLRARTNLAVLQNNGPNLTRIRQVPEGYDTPRRSVNFDEPAKDQSSTDVQTNVLNTTTINAASDKTISSLADKSTPGGSVAKSATPLSIQRQKIAEGVILKKLNLSINSTSTPVKSKQVHPLNMLISTNDIEQDRQKEYKRRVLDLLDEEEPIEKPGVSSTPSLPIIAAPMTTSVPAATTSLGLPVITAAASSSAATAAAVSASLDSLNKLVQSATAGSGLSLSTAGSSAAMATSSTNSLSQMLQASGGNSLATSSVASALNKEVSFGFTAATQPSQTASTELSTTSSATGGFQFGASSSSTPSVESTQSTPAATTSGFQINFSATSAPLGVASTAAASVAAAPSAVSMGSGQQSSNGGFSFGLGSTSSSQPNTGMFGPALGGQQSANSGFNFGSFPASQTMSSIAGSAAGAPVFSGMTQATALSSAPSVNQLNSAPRNTDISFKGPSAQTVAGNTPVSLSTGGNFVSGIAQTASSSAPFSLTSTLQAFAASQSKDEGSVTKPTTSGMQGQGFALNATPFSTSVAPSTSTPGLFNFGGPNTTASLSTGFGFGHSGAGAAQQGNATVMSSSQAPSTAGGTPSNFGFNFGASSATTTAPHQPSGPSFGVGPASSLPASSGFTSGGFTGQSSFTGFGLNTQSNSTTTAFTNGGLQPQGLFTSTGASGPASSQPFGSAGASAFGNSSQASLTGQQPFGTSSAPGLSMFGPAATTTTTASTGLFSFGQTSAPTTTTSTNTFAFGPSSTSNAFSKPFAFGAASSAQPAPGFGGVTTTSNSLFGNIVSPAPSAGAVSMFGGGTTSAFGTNSITSPFGSSAQATAAPIFGSTGPTTSTQAFGSMVPTTSPPAFGSMVPTTSPPAFGSMVPTTSLPAFGSMVPTTSPPAFGSMVPTTSPPAFGSMVPTTSPPAFGSTINTPMFGATNSQTSSVFGSAAPSGGQPASMFGASAASSNQLFTFGSGGGSQTASQPASTFGSNPSGSFGSTAAAGSSMFGAKPAAPVFSSATTNPATMFGTPAQSQTSAAFGSSFGMSNTFGAQQTTDKPAFGAASAAFGTSAGSSFGTAAGSSFGTSAGSSFGVTPQNSVFGAAPQNSASNLFGVAPQNLPPAFGSQPGASQAVAPSSFGGTVSSGASVFGAAKPNPFGAAPTSQANFNFATTQANQFNAQPANSGFNFNQTNTQPAAINAGFNFAAQTPTRPQLPAPSPGGFNFSANAAGQAPQAFNFSATPNNPNPFTPQTPGTVPRPRAAAARRARRGGTRR